MCKSDTDLGLKSSYMKESLWEDVFLDTEETTVFFLHDSVNVPYPTHPYETRGPT